MFEGKGRGWLWMNPEGLGIGKKMILAMGRGGRLRMAVGVR